MRLYADTSLLVSYYVTDANSAQAQSLIHATPGPLVFTGLHRLALRNALQLGVFRRLITVAQARAAWQDVQRDLRAERLVPVAVNWVPILRSTFQMAASHSAGIGCRSLDVLHVATANKLGASERLSFDSRQRTLGQAVGLTVKP
jgi:predicted nucleic acid-binding protein